MSSLGFLKSAMGQLRRHPASRNLPYALGRFASIRRSYGEALGGLQSLGAVPGVQPLDGASLFGELDVASRVDDIRRHSATFGLRLPSDVVTQLLERARSSELQQWATGRRFRLDEVREGRFADGEAAILADVRGAGLLQELLRVARDPGLLSIVTGYLRYRPIGCDPRILWSFAGNYSDTERQRIGQTFEYHFDVHSYSFTYANFYLVDVDTSNGAHAMVLGSHDDKPLSWLAGSAKRSDAAIELHYGASRIRTIEGPAGTGFVQDSSCFHKVHCPHTRDRVMVHLRYY